MPKQLASEVSLVRAMDSVIRSAYYDFARTMELEITKKISGSQIDVGVGKLRLRAEQYEEAIVEKLLQTECRKGDVRARVRCLKSFFRNNRVPDILIFSEGKVFGKREFRVTFLEVGVSDRYYYSKPAIQQNSPSRVIRDAYFNKRGKPFEGKVRGVVLDVETAKNYIGVMKKLGKFDVNNFLPRKSEFPRIEHEKIEHFGNPIPDITKRIYGRIPVYFGYYFSDDVLLTMSFLEVIKVGKVKTESVRTYGHVEKSKNTIVPARSMKPVELLAIERLFGVIVNVSDVDGKATINSRHNSYYVNWVGKVSGDWRRITSIRKVGKRPKNIKEMVAVVLNATRSPL